ncbi:aldose 1-epimerase family protein [Clostridium isatidis]|uniref:Galactose mutarotase n=1 Tax=Clostridium isatidis TaxID=182773 RepID=A0A343JFG7_9CLOT|nr:aldose 1-epimerase family protein [Clostridium isatidis]ASW44275.1 galactose mutarotase [Clostridium isatidis]NLZ34934.1 aldose 1-epimerase family protein [Clostridiales bacterium]
MIYTLENEKIKITANTYGGELNNLITKKDSVEFLWNGDEAYWKYHSPILFPIVGKVLDGKYIVDGKEYNLPQHGLARVREFNMIEKTENRIVFELLWNEDTLKLYPYKFSLRLSYDLLEDGVKVGYEVKNLDNKDMYFSIGGHPAFMCPLFENEKFEDYYFEFDQKETAEVMLTDINTGYFTRERKEFLNNQNKIKLDLKLFEYDALIFDSLKSNSITLKSDKNNKSITMDFTNFPYLALWTKATGAPFICIEPWYGHGDFFDFKGDFKDKEGNQMLKSNEIFTASYSLHLK